MLTVESTNKEEKPSSASFPELTFIPEHSGMDHFLEAGLTQTARQDIAPLCTGTLISRQVIITGLKGLCNVSMLDLWSTEGGAGGAKDSKVRSIIDMCLVRKWARHLCGCVHLVMGQ